MNITRRNLLLGAVAGAAAVVAPREACAEEGAASASAVALLYDSTRCVGCQACVSACAEANHLAGDGTLEVLPAARGLSARSLNVIQIYKAPQGSETAFVKKQCMHCIDPACVASCPFGALKKDAVTGIVRWTSSLCIGCRYCEVVCPYHVPHFQWSGFNPRIAKCELCSPRLAAGQEPACTSVCPAQAVVFGKRENLLAEGHRRIAEHPGRYFENRIYGEKDGGGTQALYLSHTGFDQLGLPRLSETSTPARNLRWQKRIYSYLAAPAVAYALLVGVIGKRWRAYRFHELKEERASRLRSQL